MAPPVESGSLTPYSASNIINWVNGAVIPLTPAVLIPGIAEISTGTGRFNLDTWDTDWTGYLATSVSIAVYSESTCQSSSLIRRQGLMHGFMTLRISPTTRSALLSLISGQSFYINAGGYVRLELVNFGAFAMQATAIRALSALISYDNFTGLTYTTQCFIARYFANGLYLGTNNPSNTQYASIYTNSSDMIRYSTNGEIFVNNNIGLQSTIAIENTAQDGPYLTASYEDGFSFLLDSTGLAFRRSFDTYNRRLLNSSSRGYPTATLAKGIFKIGTSSPAMGSYLTSDGSTISIKYGSSTGRYIVTVPTAWGSNYLVMLTPAGRTSALNPVIVGVALKTPGSFTIDAKSSADNWLSESSNIDVQFMILDMNVF